MDVLLVIFARLTAVDLIRSGAVCVSWRSAVETRRALQPPLRTIRPWLMRFQDINDHCLRFVDTSTGKTYIIHLPELNQKRLVGKSDHGFLVYEDNLSKRLSMINPITRATICLPPLPLRLGGVFRVSVVSSSSPSSSGEEGTTGTGYTAVILSAGGCGLYSAFADARNLSTWVRVSRTLNNVRWFHICGKKLYGFFHRSNLGVDEFCQLFTCDLHDPTDFKVWAFKFYYSPWSLSDFGGSLPVHGVYKCKSDCLKRCCHTFYYPVVLPNGDLIVVCRVSVSFPCTTFVKVYKMPTDLHGEAEILTSIGDCALFLDLHRSIVLSTLEFPELKPNTIYFSDDCHYVVYSNRGPSRVNGLVMFDLEAQHLVACHPMWTTISDHTGSQWFMPAF